jgi:hypothetical protein
VSSLVESDAMVRGFSTIAAGSDQLDIGCTKAGQEAPPSRRIIIHLSTTMR